MTIYTEDIYTYCTCASKSAGVQVHETQEAMYCSARWQSKEIVGVIKYTQLKRGCSPREMYALRLNVEPSGAILNPRLAHVTDSELEPSASTGATRGCICWYV